MRQGNRTGRKYICLNIHRHLMLNKSLIGSSKDVYYIDRDGAYPFAIDIPMLNFIPVTETHNIDTEYPYFKNWADSWGSKSTDWYKRYQSPKN